MLRLLYAGRFVECKHPEFALALADRLRERGVRFRLDMVGGGEMDAALREEAARLRFSEEQVSFRGYLPPDEVRTYMERAHIFLFPSNHLEGWGAVVNEAMNSGCAVIAGTESGAAPYLIRQGENGVLFERESRRDFLDKADWLIGDPARIRACGQQAQRTIEELWNAERAARELLRFTRYVLRSRQAGIRPTADGWDPPAEGPMSLAPVQRPFVKAGKLP